MLGTARPNTLLIGSEAAADAVIAHRLPYLRAPIVNWHPRVAVEPGIVSGTLVVRDVDTLDRAQQEQFFAWLDRYAAGVQVISVTESPLYSAVLAGAFLEKLYYRLNVVCLPLSSPAPSVGQTVPFLTAQVAQCGSRVAHDDRKRGISFARYVTVSKSTGHEQRSYRWPKTIALHTASWATSIQRPPLEIIRAVRSIWKMTTRKPINR